jgi:hypothetical protein
MNPHVHRASGLLAVVAAAVVVPSSLAGCDGLGAGGTCTTYPACGGNPQGAWNLNDACLNLEVKPYQPTTLLQEEQQPQDPTVSPPQPVAATSGSWCSDLVYQPSDATAPIKSVILWHGPLDVRGGTVFHNPDFTYTATIIFGRPQETFFSASCLGKYQTSVTQNDAAMCSSLAAGLMTFLISQPSFQKIVCLPKEGGCDCTYDYQLIEADNGVWEVDPNDKNVLIHHSKASSEPQRTTFCVGQGGSTLTMTGEEGTSILNQVGLRSLSYVKM